MVTDKHDFIANFNTETYNVYCDDKEVDSITSGCWANLEDIFAAARDKVELYLPKGKKVCTGYICTDRNRIMFWTYTVNDWWTL
jgi:hypothetical protein